MFLSPCCQWPLAEKWTLLGKKSYCRRCEKKVVPTCYVTNCCQSQLFRTEFVNKALCQKCCKCKRYCKIIPLEA